MPSRAPTFCRRRPIERRISLLGAWRAHARFACLPPRAIPWPTSVDSAAEKGARSRPSRWTGTRGSSLWAYGTGRAERQRYRRIALVTCNCSCLPAEATILLCTSAYSRQRLFFICLYISVTLSISRAILLIMNTSPYCGYSCRLIDYGSKDAVAWTLVSRRIVPATPSRRVDSETRASHAHFNAE